MSLGAALHLKIAFQEYIAFKTVQAITRLLLFFHLKGDHLHTLISWLQLFSEIRRQHNYLEVFISSKGRIHKAGWLCESVELGVLKDYPSIFLLVNDLLLWTLDN